MKHAIIPAAVLSLFVLAGCGTEGPATFGSDRDFLLEHTDAVVLTGPDAQAQVVVVPQYQGRVMTSTSGGDDGMSCGWINRALIASGKTGPHMNVFGGEDRLWFAPEGGQFSIFFKKGQPFDMKHWQTPPLIDTEPYEVLVSTRDSVSFRKHARLVNYSGTRFTLQIDRTVRLLSAAEIATALKAPLPAGVRAVAYQSESTLANAGNTPWDKTTGLLSIWILGQYNATPQTTVAIPFKTGPEAEFGPVLNRYPSFGTLLPERLRVADGVVYFRADGRRRNKIGLFSRRAKGVCGSYDAVNKLLTIVQYNQPGGPADYANSTWAIQTRPYVGDAISSYNDGPITPGAKSLGGLFYEMETLSPAVALKPGASVLHVHRTIHLQGDVAALSRIAKATLGVTVEQITAALRPIP